MHAGKVSVFVVAPGVLIERKDREFLSGLIN